MTCLQVVTNWFIGSREENILPYRRLRANSFATTKLKGTFQKISRFMSVVEFYAEAKNCLIQDSDKATIRNVTKVWESIRWIYIHRKYIEMDYSRFDTLSWVTVMNKMVKKGAFKTSRVDCEDEDQWKRSIYNQNSVYLSQEEEEELNLEFLALATT